MLTERDLTIIRMGSLDEVNSVMLKIQEEMMQSVLLALPGTVMNLLRYGKKMRESAESFYADNPVLAENKDLVTHIASIVESENPGMEIEKVLAQVKDRALSELSSAAKPTQESLRNIASQLRS